ncbi:hypothetical protein F511_26972 [Dorcoceras hygrometricum]|uniref:Uncharacterized protein n=1 Tax=Dorcoceras hygrometricum TaxID=472368 RepID=A0A2Z7CPB2_9LAMI|nr:hypothetical protein F511_26972 [Dorcoceras hygrometricum]
MGWFIGEEKVARPPGQAKHGPWMVREGPIGPRGGSTDGAPAMGGRSTVIIGEEAAVVRRMGIVCGLCSVSRVPLHGPVGSDGPVGSVGSGWPAGRGGGLAGGALAMVGRSTAIVGREAAVVRRMGSVCGVCTMLRVPLHGPAGPRPEGRLLRQPALEGLTRSARTDSPRKTDRSKSDQLAATAVEAGGDGGFWESRGRPRSTTIGKSRVAIDPIAMHTSWRSNSDIASVTSIGYPRMSASGILDNDASTPTCIGHNQDLGLIHSTNGNHLESPNEGSSIDHQVTIYLHAQNITMFPTNETWYFASQILVSSSGGLILILTAQSTRN